MRNYLPGVILLLFLINLSPVRGQKLNLGNISGSFQSDAQWYFEDPVINAQGVDENVLSNSFLQLTYTRGKFSAGVRYEAYMNPLLGFRGEYQGHGIPYRFANYHSGIIDITVGHFYDQFGSGMVFRTYQEWYLGIDNSLDGARVKLNPLKGLYLKALIGKQRKFWDKSEGLLRGGDIEWYAHESFPKLREKKWQISLGASIMNRFLDDTDVTRKLPENVSNMGGRFSVSKGGFNVNGEYAYKINDPFNKNAFTYNSGNGIYLNASYTQKGLGITATAKRIDNMDFRSERSVQIEELTVNFLPPTTLQHTYRLPTLYPYATQPNGEFGIQADIIYTFKKGTPIGGKYGTQIYLNYARIHGLRKTPKDSIFTYTSDFFWDPEKRYFEDINVEISKKISKKLKLNFNYIYLVYDKGVIELGDENSSIPVVHTHVTVLEASYKVKRKQNLRMEFQHMYTRQDLGSWLMLLAEYSVSPHWYFSIYDEFNYGLDFRLDNPAHYYNFNVAYVFGPNRIAVNYGRQRAGLLCVGGICRVVPSSRGLSVSITSSF